MGREYELDDFESIVRRFYHAVKSFLKRRGVPDQDLEDLIQEVFLRVYKGIPGFRGESGFPSWLFTIAFNVYRDWLKRKPPWERGNLSVPVDDDPPEAGGGGQTLSLSDTEDDPQQALTRMERSQLLYEAVDGLPPKMKSCVELRLRGSKYQEIAVELGLAIGTVKAHLSEARRRLKEALGDYFDGIEF